MTKPTSKNRVRQARHAAEAAGVPDPEARAMRVGRVVDFRANAHGLEWLRRMVNRELREELRELAAAEPKPGQPDADFVRFYRNKERRAAFMQDLVGQIEAARIED